MYTDVEKVIEKVASALDFFASFYCGYTGAATRLRVIYNGLNGGDRVKAQAQLRILLSAALHRCGVYFTPYSRVRMLELEDLLRVCRVFGLSYVGQPNIEDGATQYLGMPATFDFIVRKARNRNLRDLLLERQAVETDWLEDLERIARNGAPAFVCEVIRAVDPELADAATHDLYARAAIRAGRSREDEIRQMFEIPVAGGRLSDLATGVFWHDRGDINRALASYAQLSDEHPDKSFLMGLSLLQRREWEQARALFQSALAEGAGGLRASVGLVATYAFAGDFDEARLAFGAIERSAASVDAGERLAALDIQAAAS